MLVVLWIFQDLADEIGDLVHLLFTHASGSDRRGTDPNTRGHQWWLGIVGNRVLVDGDRSLLQGLLDRLAGMAGGGDVDQKHVIVGSAGDNPQSPLG